MAEKRITTVDEVMTVDESADYVLIVRGTQKDLKRLLIRRFPQDFDIHDDVADELTTLAGIDRLAISDEGSPGAPQKFVRLSTLRSFFLDLFDLHDDVPVELTEAADEDRLLISAEDEPGDPQKYITVVNLLNRAPGIKQQTLSTEHEPDGTPTYTRVVENHTLGRKPLGVHPIAVCKRANLGYSVGDEVTLTFMAYTNGTFTMHAGCAIIDASKTQVTIGFSTGENSSNHGIPLPRKDTGAWSRASWSNWKVKFLIWG